MPVIITSDTSTRNQGSSSEAHTQEPQSFDALAFSENGNAPLPPDPVYSIKNDGTLEWVHGILLQKMTEEALPYPIPIVHIEDELYWPLEVPAITYMSYIESISRHFPHLEILMTRPNGHNNLCRMKLVGFGQPVGVSTESDVAALLNITSTLGRPDPPPPPAPAVAVAPVAAPKPRRRSTVVAGPDPHSSKARTANLGLQGWFGSGISKALRPDPKTKTVISAPAPAPGSSYKAEQRGLQVMNVAANKPKGLVFILEGLEYNTIASLGTSFDVDPEFYFDYLVGSSYEKRNVPRLEYESWDTSGSSRNRVSIEWFRGWTESSGRVGFADSQYVENYGYGVNLGRELWTILEPGNSDPFYISREKFSLWQNTEMNACIVIVDPSEKEVKEPGPERMTVLRPQRAFGYYKVPRYKAFTKESQGNFDYRANLMLQPTFQTYFEAVREAFAEESKESAYSNSSLAWYCCIQTIGKIIVHDTRLLMSEMGRRLDLINRRLSSSKTLETEIDDIRHKLTTLREVIRLIVNAVQRFDDLSKDSSHQFHTQGFRSANMFDGSNKPSQPSPAGSSLHAETLDMNSRIEATFSAFMSTLSVHESERAIKEAESVTKLSELAFFFIPLTFAASLFSMQIKAMETFFTVGNWVALSASMMAFLYIVRFGIRSNKMHQYQSDFISDVRELSKIPPGMPINNRAFLKYFQYHLPTQPYFKSRVQANESFRYVLSIFLSSRLILPFVGFIVGVSLTWTMGKHLPQPIKVLCTLVCCTFGLGYSLVRLYLHVKAGSDKTSRRNMAEILRKERRKDLRVLKMIILIPVKILFALFLLFATLHGILISFMLLSSASVALTWTIGRKMDPELKIVVTIFGTVIGVLYPLWLLYFRADGLKRENELFTGTRLRSSSRWSFGSTSDFESDLYPGSSSGSSSDTASSTVTSSVAASDENGQIITTPKPSIVARILSRFRLRSRDSDGSALAQEKSSGEQQEDSAPQPPSLAEVETSDPKPDVRIVDFAPEGASIAVLEGDAATRAMSNLSRKMYFT